MATHSSILSWKSPSIQEPGGLQSIGLSSILTMGKHEQAVEGGLKGLQPKNYSDSKAKIVSSKFYESYCIYLCRPFHSLHQKLSDIHLSSFHNGFLTDLQGKRWQGGASWRFQKGISFFPINFCTMKFEVERHWTEQSRQLASASGGGAPGMCWMHIL